MKAELVGKRGQPSARATQQPMITLLIERGPPMLPTTPGYSDNRSRFSTNLLIVCNIAYKISYNPAARLFTHENNEFYIF